MTVSLRISYRTNSRAYPITATETIRSCTRQTEVHADTCYETSYLPPLIETNTKVIKNNN